MEDNKKFDIVVVSGGFDPVHKGHIRMFKGAKNLGHKVICGLNSDKWLVNKKGKSFMSFSERAEILESIKYIDDINLPIEELADAHKYWLKKYMDS